MQHTNAQLDPNSRPDTAMVSRLVVFHLDDDISTPISVLPDQLEHFNSTQRFETTDPNDFLAACDALEASGPLPTSGGIDARWGVLFLGHDLNPLFSAYTDRFGLQGMIDGTLVRFSRGAFLKWLMERFSA